MALEWIPQGRTFEWVDDDGPHEKNVIGMLAYVEDGTFYEIWPIDPKGTPDKGWTLDHHDNDDILDSQGAFSTYDSATAFAGAHISNAGLRDANSAAAPATE